MVTWTFNAKDDKEKLNAKLELNAGDIVIYDFRENLSISSNVPTISTGTNGKVGSFTPKVTLKCVQWNIERGYKLDQVIKLLKSQHAEIICLQELDIDCERSDNRNCALEIAKALKMKCAFFVEFEELLSPKRKRNVQGGGVHGNAILSIFDLESWVIPHKHHPINWERDGIKFGEPRRGERAIIAADIFVPGMDRPILCYSLHLEVFCGIFGRIKQFADVLEYSKSRIDNNDRPFQLIFGDLNTMAHGIARFCPVYCQDWLRYGSIGLSESAWWDKNILSIVESGANRQLKPFASKYLSSNDIQNLTNPYFFDPFSINTDTTLQGYYGLYQGKLDWCLLRGFRVIGKGMENKEYQDSDHRLLHVIVRPVAFEEEDGNVGKIAYAEHYVPLGHSRSKRLAIYIISAIVLFVALVSLICPLSRF